MKHSKHKLTYIDLHPAPIPQDPPAWAIWLGAAVTAAGVYLVLICAFSF